MLTTLSVPSHLRNSAAQLLSRLEGATTSTFLAVTEPATGDWNVAKYKLAWYPAKRRKFFYYEGSNTCFRRVHIRATVCRVLPSPMSSK